MNTPTESWLFQQEHIPHSGQHILAHCDAETIIVYQAYHPQIAGYAVKHQQLGGPHYSMNRMSWIKPNFLWMMYRCGWASKENQERVLAIRIRQNDFETILGEAVYSSFQPHIYADHAAWKKALAAKNVRLQWDPDHDPHGKPLARRAIQLGMKDDTLRKFCTEYTLSIEDITGFVKAQYAHVAGNQPELLQVPVERLFLPGDDRLKERLGLS